VFATNILSYFICLCAVSYVKLD